jgi:putative endonuclease
MIDLEESQGSAWYVYIVRCADNTLYTGITTNLQRRIDEHNSEEGGAKYTRPRRPVDIVYHELAISRSEASKREYQIKKMRLQAKLDMIAGHLVES